MSLASGSPEPIPTDIPPDPESGIEVAVVAYPEDTDTAVASGLLPAGKPRSTWRSSTRRSLAPFAFAVRT